jgi:xanthine dehydrogenase accessory factor
MEPGRAGLAGPERIVTDRKIAREALRLLEERRPFVRATVVRAAGSVPGKVGASMIIREDGTILGTVGGAALEEKVKELAAEALVQQRGDLHHFDLQRWREGGLPSLCGGSVDIAVEYIGAAPHLLIWGGGHVSQALAQLLPGLEYDYTIADDRPEWITTERFPAALERLLVSPAALWDRAVPASFSHLFVLGYDASKDLEVVAVSLLRFRGHIGLIASESKREHMFADLRHRGVTEEALGRIHSPIGLPIGAQSPAEIAVSVVAEMVRDRNAGRGRRGESSEVGASREHHGVGTA